MSAGNGQGASGGPGRGSGAGDRAKRGAGAGRQTAAVTDAAEKEKAFLIAVDTGDDVGWNAEESLAELAALVETAGGEVVGTLIQRREAIHPLWYLGSGKAEELKQAKGENGFTMLVADDELSPKQQRSLEKLLNLKVLDRSGIILDIFAQRAHTHEGRIQVELAQLEYQLPRLTRLWTHLSRMGGAAAVEDMLFATLDPTTRRVRLREGQTVIVSDTVGFIHKLPHQLVEAFRATLEEVTRADILLEVVDLTDAHAAEHRRTVQTVLDELKAGHKPRVVVLNKADLADASGDGSGGAANPGLGAGFGTMISGKANYGGLLGRADRYAVKVSALTGEGIDELRGMIATVLADLWLEVDVAVPYSAGELLARVRERGNVEFEYRDEDVRIVGRVPPSVAGNLDNAARAWKRARRARKTEE